MLPFYIIDNRLKSTENHTMTLEEIKSLKHEELLASDEAWEALEAMSSTKLEELLDNVFDIWPDDKHKFVNGVYTKILDILEERDAA